MDNRTRAKVSGDGSQSLLAKVPGVAVVGLWAGLFLAGFILAGLVGMAADRRDSVRAAEHSYQDVLERVRLRMAAERQREPLETRLARLREIVSRPSILDNPFIASSSHSDTVAITAVLEVLSTATRAERRMRARTVAAAVVWLLAFGFVIIGTEYWLRARRGWERVQSWHGAKLLILYLAFTAIAFFFFSLSAVSRSSPADITLAITSTALFLASGTMLVRATWRWLTGREAKH